MTLLNPEIPPPKTVFDLCVGADFEKLRSLMSCIISGRCSSLSSVLRLALNQRIVECNVVLSLVKDAMPLLPLSLSLAIFGTQDKAAAEEEEEDDDDDEIGREHQGNEGGRASDDHLLVEQDLEMNGRLKIEQEIENSSVAEAPSLGCPSGPRRMKAQP